MASSNGTFSKPDTISYNNLLHLYANKGDFEKAEALLRQMEQTSVESHSSSTTLPIHQFPIGHEITADVFSYSIVINALRKRFVSGGVNRDMDDPVRAERILMQMVKNGVMPNDVCYSTVLSLYAVADRLMREELSNPKSRKWKNIGLVSNNIGWGAENAERVLDWMIDLYEREEQDGQGERVQINSQHFTTVIDAWAKAGKGVEGAKHCERLCDRLVSLYEKSGEDFLRPRPEVCTTPRSIMICLDYANKASSIIL
jgi:pentatricopeptide repeat protein